MDACFSPISNNILKFRIPHSSPEQNPLVWESSVLQSFRSRTTALLALIFFIDLLFSFELMQQKRKSCSQNHG